MLVFDFLFGFEPMFEIFSGRTTVAFPKKIGSLTDGSLLRDCVAMLDGHEGSPFKKERAGVRPGPIRASINSNRTAL
jgi:hypothetical protein